MEPIFPMAQAASYLLDSTFSLQHSWDADVLWLQRRQQLTSLLILACSLSLHQKESLTTTKSHPSPPTPQSQPITQSSGVGSLSGVKQHSCLFSEVLTLAAKVRHDEAATTGHVKYAASRHQQSLNNNCFHFQPPRLPFNLRCTRQ